MTATPRVIFQPVSGTLSDLLLRWARLEPGRCRFDRGCYLVNVESHWHALCGNDNRLPALQGGVLQIALQDALAEHNLDWTLAAQGGSVSATITSENALTYEITTHSEAMSLLWIYLEALSPTCGLDA